MFAQVQSFARSNFFRQSANERCTRLGRNNQLARNDLRRMTGIDAPRQPEDRKGPGNGTCCTQKPSTAPIYSDSRIDRWIDQVNLLVLEFVRMSDDPAASRVSRRKAKYVQFLGV
jgi:hypothetical protein